MRIDCLQVAGFSFAIMGAMLSKGKVDYNTLLEAAMNNKMPEDLIERATALAAKLSGADGGHNKFLEQVQYWIVIDAPLYWWKQFDTYRIGVSKSSESTMFKMWKGGLTENDFDHSVYPETLARLNESIKKYNETKDEELFTEIISNLPDSFLQTRMVNINAKSLRNIYMQRNAHKLKEWRDFCEFITELPYGGLITK